MTLHKILAGCEEGSHDAWRAFLTAYTPVAFQFFAVYLPRTTEQRLETWGQATRALCANNFERLGSFSHQSEREFLVDLRAFLFEHLAPGIDPSQDLATPPSPTVESLRTLLKGLPLLHQEFVVLTLAGYTQATVEKIMRLSAGVAQEGLERLRAAYTPVLDRSENGCLWPAAWTALILAVRALKGEGCAPLRLLVRILDGQASWYEKTPVEEHRSTCPACLELWTSLLEVAWWGRESKPWTPEQVAPLLSGLPVRAAQKTRSSLFAKILGK